MTSAQYSSAGGEVPVTCESRGAVVAQIVRCPLCRGEVQVPESLYGAAVECPRCSGRFAAPDLLPTVTTTRPAVAPTLPPEERKFCTECGSTIRRKAVVCPSCGVPQPGASMAFAPPPSSAVNTNRLPAGIFGVLLGCLGVHKFILGYTFEGVIMLLVTIFGSPCLGIGFIVMWTIGLVEGIIYLTKSDAEFHATYEVGRRGWF